MPHNVYSIQKSWQALDVKGPEARDFLNRVTSVDFARLGPGRFSPGTLLSPTGKMLIYFKALPLEEGHYLLLVPPMGADTSAATPAAQAAYDAFERLHFREQLTITPLADEWVYLRALASDASAVDRLAALTPPPGHISTTGNAIPVADSIVINEAKWIKPPVRLDLGIIVKASGGDLAEMTALLRQAGLEERESLAAYRLRAADPATPSELNANTMPLEARLDDAVHENKGCYPGQEVIERIRAMGQPPRLLATLRGSGPAPRIDAGQAVELNAEGQPAGSLTSAADDPIDGGWVGLGYVKRVCAKPESVYTVGAQTVSLEIK